MKNLIITLILIIVIVCPAITIVKKIHFKQNCSGYIKQAADANTIELSLERLNMAIDYIEEHELTDGYTSILWKTEDENVGFWYRNLKTCQSELQKNINSSPLEKSNVLMRVREALTDNKNGETSLTIPNGISRYPNNLLWAILNTISAIFIISSFGYMYDMR